MGEADTPPIVMVNRSRRSIALGGTKPNCEKCEGTGACVWPDGFAIKCPDCGGWGAK
jgi:hypothetical protein